MRESSILADSYSDLSSGGLDILYKTISLVFQSFFYGIYALLIPFSINALLKRGLKSRTSIFLLCTMSIQFVLSSVYWALCLAEQLVLIQILTIDPSLRNHHNITTYSTLFNAIVLINYIFADAVVVWRAWALCGSKYKMMLILSVFLLLSVASSVFSTIALRVASLFDPGSTRINNAINFLQISNLVWSLATNICATSIISHKTWQYRTIFRAGLRNSRNNRTKIERLLTMFIETGIIYCISGVTVLAASIIKLPHGTLGDIYTPINIQIAGIYPTIITVIVGLERTMNDTTFQHTTATSSQPQFTSISLGSQGQLNSSLVDPQYDRGCKEQ